ncbi:MAG: hypothetical protein U0174_24385 [Polyangiaceae bacterium]
MSLGGFSRLPLLPLLSAFAAVALVGAERSADACIPYYGEPSVLGVGDHFVAHVRLDGQNGEGYLQTILSSATTVAKASPVLLTGSASGPARFLAEHPTYTNGVLEYELVAMDANGGMLPTRVKHACSGTLSRVAGGWNRASLCKGVLERSFFDDTGVEHVIETSKTALPGDRLIAVGGGAGSHYSFFAKEDEIVARIALADGSEQDVALSGVDPRVQGAASGLVVTTNADTKRASVRRLHASGPSTPLYTVDAAGPVAVAARTKGTFIVYATPDGNNAFELRDNEGALTKSGKFGGPFPRDATCTPNACLVVMGGGYGQAPMFALVTEDGVARSLSNPPTAESATDNLGTRCSAPLPGSGATPPATTPSGSPQGRDEALGSTTSCSLGLPSTAESASTASIGVGLCLLGFLLAHRRSRRED